MAEDLAKTVEDLEQQLSSQRAVNTKQRKDIAGLRSDINRLAQFLSKLPADMVDDKDTVGTAIKMLTAFIEATPKKPEMTPEEQHCLEAFREWKAGPKAYTGVFHWRVV